MKTEFLAYTFSQQKNLIERRKKQNSRVYCDQKGLTQFRKLHGHSLQKYSKRKTKSQVNTRRQERNLKSNSKIDQLNCLSSSYKKGLLALCKQRKADTNEF